MNALNESMFKVGAKQLLKTMAADPKTQADPCMAKLVALATDFKPGSIKMSLRDRYVFISFETNDGVKHSAEIL